MTLNRLILRNLIFFRRTNLPVIAGVAAAVAVLSGALLVGQSVRESLRRLLFERIGAAEYVLTADAFFSEKLAGSLPDTAAACPIISIKGVLSHEKTGIRAHNVNVYGVDERFWKFQNLDYPAFPGIRAGLLGEALARELDAQPGDALLLRIEKQQAIPREWLYGRRDDIGKTIRLNCGGILPANRLGEFSLRPHQGKIHCVYVPLKLLQRELEQLMRVNAILISGALPGRRTESVLNALTKQFSLEDLGMRLRASASRNSFTLESSRIILDDFIAKAAMRASEEAGMKVSPLYTYLANSIRYQAREIPYSVITAVDLEKGAMTSVQKIASSSGRSLSLQPAESIWITEWARQNLAVSEGEPVEIDYYFWQEDGRLVTRTARFRVAGVLSITGDVDRALAPEIPGITQARSLSSWDPPFPLDLRRIRREDEDYWNRYRATPKAFIPLARGQELWATRFGKLTGLRISPPSGIDRQTGQQQWTSAFLRNLDSREAGFGLEPVREKGLAASQGSTDFGEYFVYFSSFLIAAAILLAALFFRLMTEQRVSEIGLLRAAGFSAGMLRRLFIAEGFILSCAGSLLGALGSLAYAGIMMSGLRTWWAGAVGTQHLYLHLSWKELTVGAAAGMLFSLAIIVWTLRGLHRNSPRSLLAGILESAARRRERMRTFSVISVLALLAAAALILCSQLGKLSAIEGFFGAGFSLLLSILCATGVYLRSRHANLIRGNGWPAFFRFGIKNAMHRPGRSLLCASLIASAAFIIVSMEAFRRDPGRMPLDARSGTGGYPFIAETVLPVLHDPNSAAGLEAMGLPVEEIPALKQARFIPFRERPGDDASCLNLYAPQEPRILGAPRPFISAGRFSFQKSLAATPAEKDNPWRLLESAAHSPAIPAIADANTIQYILRLSVGSELTLRGNQGNPVRLRLVASLRDSIFQGVLLISESNFLRLFPEQAGYRFFLLEAPPAAATTLLKPLKQALADYGIHLEPSPERLQSFHRVENTYLSTFQALGALGMILGTLGLAAVLLRNVLERRKELALLRSVGYRREVLAGIVLCEHVVLILWGLAAGMICALLAILPALAAREQSFPFLMAGLILLSVFIAGTLSSILALAAAFRSPLLTALRSE